MDNAELSKRLVEMKMTEIDRMNDVNNICNEMMRNARSMERAAAAESSSRQVLGKFFNANKSNGLKQGMATVRPLELIWHLNAWLAFPENPVSASGQAAV